MEAALTGINAARVRLAVSAHNVANWLTPDYCAQRVVQSAQPNFRGTSVRVVRTDLPTDLASEMVGQLLTVNYMKANGAVLKIQAEMRGSLIDMFA